MVTNWELNNGLNGASATNNSPFPSHEIVLLLKLIKVISTVRIFFRFFLIVVAFWIVIVPFSLEQIGNSVVIWVELKFARENVSYLVMVYFWEQFLAFELIGPIM